MLFRSDAFNIDPGLFATFDQFSPYVLRVENTEQFGGGKGPETTTELINRASTAVSVRNPVNERSIQALLYDLYPSLKNAVVIGYGDPEMQRDRLDNLGTHLALHIGGHTDVYLLLDLVETAFEGTVGDLYARPDNIINVLRDTDGTDLSGVSAGNIVRIAAGIDGAPREFMVVEGGHADYLLVSENVPFPSSTEEATPPGNVGYTVGLTPPNFSDIIADLGMPYIHGVTSRRVQNTGCITLPGGPVMDILDVAVLDPPVGEMSWIDPVDGYIHFTGRVNTTPAPAVTPGTDTLEFRTIVHNPLKAQSSQQWMEVMIGQVGNLTRYDGLRLRVRYLTLSGYDTIYAYMLDRKERVNCANQLPRGHFPVTLAMAVNYRLKTTAASLLDQADAAQKLAVYINQFDTSTQPLDTSTIAKFLKDTYPDIAAIFPITVTYTLQAPTGDIVRYGSFSEIRIGSSYIVGPVPAYDLAAYGVSDRTVRYLTTAAALTFVDRGVI